MLAGDFNQLLDNAVVERTGLTQLVRQPTRGANLLDRVYASNPLDYTTVRVVTATVKSDHKAVVVYSDHKPATHKITYPRTYRKITPNKHASFLQYISTLTMEIPTCSTIQAQFDYFYSFAVNLLNTFYPENTISVTSRDPDFITPAIKAKLRRKNRLMRRGKIEEASALADRIRKDILHRSRSRLSKLEGKADVRDVWAAVRQLTGRERHSVDVDGVDAHNLNAHYANISTDLHYTAPLRKLTATHLDYSELSLNGASLISSTPFDLQPQASTNCPLGSLDLARHSSLNQSHTYLTYVLQHPWYLDSGNTLLSIPSRKSHRQKHPLTFVLYLSLPFLPASSNESSPETTSIRLFSLRLLHFHSPTSSPSVHQARPLLLLLQSFTQ